MVLPRLSVSVGISRISARVIRPARTVPTLVARTASTPRFMIDFDVRRTGYARARARCELTRSTAIGVTFHCHRQGEIASGTDALRRGDTARLIRRLSPSVLLLLLPSFHPFSSSLSLARALALLAPDRLAIDQ